MTICNRCKGEIKWPQPFVQGNKPLNIDDTPHTCNVPKTGGGSGKYSSSKLPLTKATEVYNLAEGILDSFYKRRGIANKLAIDQEAIFIESVFRTLSQGYKE